MSKSNAPPLSYIAFLRAVNVGGRSVKMDRLRATLEGLGLAAVRTYIQSGNVFFESVETDRGALAAAIERKLESEFGFQVTTLLRTVGEVEETLAAAPFGALSDAPDIRTFVIFLSSALPEDVAFPLSSPRGDFEIVGVRAHDAFAVARIVNGRPGNPGAYLEKTFGLRSTSRFHATTAKIVAAAHGTPALQTQQERSRGCSI